MFCCVFLGSLGFVLVFCNNLLNVFFCVVLIMICRVWFCFLIVGGLFLVCRIWIIVEGLSLFGILGVLFLGWMFFVLGFLWCLNFFIVMISLVIVCCRDFREENFLNFCVLRLVFLFLLVVILVLSIFLWILGLLVLSVNILFVWRVFFDFLRNFGFLS